MRRDLELHRQQEATEVRRTKISSRTVPGTGEGYGQALGWREMARSWERAWSREKARRRLGLLKDIKSGVCPHTADTICGAEEACGV